MIDSQQIENLALKTYGGTTSAWHRLDLLKKTHYRQAALHTLKGAFMNATNVNELVPFGFKIPSVLWESKFEQEVTEE